MFQKLRIAWSVACGTLCMLLILLWVRTFYRLDCFYWVSDREIRVWSSESKVFVNVSGKAVPTAGVEVERLQDAQRAVMEAEIQMYRRTGRSPMPKDTFLGFKWRSWSAFVVPYWFPVMLCASLAAAPWFSYATRFSLRTLLIATTLVAVALGIVVYAIR